MAEIIQLPTYEDDRGALTVLERCLPFDIKRVYWMHQVPEGAVRGRHRHLQTYQAAVCLHGSCQVHIKNTFGEQRYYLDSPEQCLLVAPEDWHSVEKFQDNSLVLWLASHCFDPQDYADAPLDVKEQSI